MKTILIDNGHGYLTPGKRSPNGTLAEWKWTRHVAQLLMDRLNAAGIPAHRIVTEDDDIPLSERVKRVNQFSAPDGKILLSLHVNASSLGDLWRKANGWSAFVAPNASTASRNLANALASQAKNQGLKVRQPRPDQNFWTQSLAICRDTHCAAVLTENLFMDNLLDCAFLVADHGIDTIVNLHFLAIQSFLR